MDIRDASQYKQKEGAASLTGAASSKTRTDLSQDVEIAIVWTDKF